MVAVRPCLELAPLVRERLRERLQAIGDGSNIQLREPPSPSQAEEALRQLMVRFRPRIAGRMIAGDVLATMLDQATVVATAAESDDLRYIDGLNAIFESWDNDYEREARAAFLDIYRSALGSLLKS